MKTFTAVCSLCLLIIGCALDRTHQDNFASLHSLVKRTLADSCDYGPIVTNELLGGRYFEVKPQPRGLTVTVSERQYFSQTEWERRYASGTNLMSQFMVTAGMNHSADTNHPIDAKTAERLAGITNLFGLSDLPDWSYQSIGVDVSVQEVDEVYPDLQEDNAVAQKRYEQIVRLLKRYRRANLRGGANGRQPFSSDTNRTSAAAASRHSP
jgi:hypothetical protein